jgi:ADP-heptose:LPS heptosyltransferase
MPDPRFLIVRLGSLGDIVHTFPAVAALRQSFPASEIVWFTHPRWKGLVGSSGLASEICTLETRSFSSLREAIHRARSIPWDAAIDYQGLWKSAALPFFGGVSRRIGFSSHTIREFGVPLLYTEHVKTRRTHIAEQNGELSLRAGAKTGTASVLLHVSETDESALRSRLRSAGIERYIVLSPGGGWRSKCWPADRFGALCRSIRDSLDLRCVVNVGPGEADLAAALRAAGRDADPLLWDSSLEQLMALLQGATCVVGGDTGPLHLAIALGTPAVALFGPTDPARNGPYRSIADQANPGDDIVLRARDAATTHRRGEHPDPSMLAITVQSVLEAVKCRVGVHR